MAQAEAELELSNMRCVEAVAQEEKEKKIVVELQKAMVDIRLKNSALEAKKVSVEDKLNTQQGNILLMLGETFNQVVRQAHLL